MDKRILFNISLCKKSNGVKIDLRRAAANIVDLQRGLTGSRALAGNAYMQKSASLQAYLLYYWPVSYVQTKAALQKCARFYEAVQKILDAENGRPIKILDLGSGPAPASCALADLAQGRGEQTMRFDFCLCDSSGEALSLGKRILENAFQKSARVEVNVCNLEKLFGQNCGREKGQGGASGGEPFFLMDKKFDFIIASHSLNELWKNEKKRDDKLFDFVSKVGERLEDGGFLLLMEPALLATSRSLIDLRDRLLQSGMSVVSPCLASAAPCPALSNSNSTCHLAFDWQMPQIVADLARLAGLNRADVKMTYFVFEKTAAVACGEEGNCAKGQDAAADSSQEKVLALVVSEPMLNKAGRVRYLLCDGKSRFSISAKNADPAASAQGFFDLKRYDKIQIVDPQIRSQKGEPLSLGFEEETQIIRRK